MDVPDVAADGRRHDVLGSSCWRTEQSPQHLQTLTWATWAQCGLALICEETRIPGEKAPFVDAGPSHGDSIKVAALGRSVQRRTCWRAFWRAWTVLLLSTCLWGPVAQNVLGDSAQKPMVGGTSAGCRCCRWWGWWNSATKADERDAVCSPQLWHQSSTPPLPVTCAAAAGENDLEPLTRKVRLSESEHVHLHFCLYGGVAASASYIFFF